MDVTIDVANRVVSCQLLESFPNTSPFFCSIIYGPSNLPSDDCDIIFNSSTSLPTGRAGSVGNIGLNQNLNLDTSYCYTVSLSYRTYTLMIYGTFRICK